jgi:hypothetical protein
LERQERDERQVDLMRTALLAFALSLISAVPAMAAGCPGKVLFQDSFATLNPAWNVAPTTASTAAVKNGKFVINLLALHTNRSELYQGDVYTDVTVCVTVQSGASDKLEDQGAAILFWAKDLTSFYVFEVTAAGYFAVERLVGGRWLMPLPAATSPAIKKGAGQANTLRVQTAGGTATLFINDQQVGTVAGTPADGGSLVGFHADGAVGSLGSWEFSNFAVTKQ